MSTPNPPSASRHITPRELKLTAALYASRDFIWNHVRDHGTLPPDLQPLGGGWIGMRLLIEERGTDITLTEREERVLEAIRREGRLRGGSVVLIDDEQSRQAKEQADQA